MKMENIIIFFAGNPKRTQLYVVVVVVVVISFPFSLKKCFGVPLEIQRQ